MTTIRRPGGATTAYPCPRCGTLTHGNPPISNLCVLCDAYGPVGARSTIGLWIAYVALAAPIAAMLFLVAVFVLSLALGV